MTPKAAGMPEEKTIPLTDERHEEAILHDRTRLSALQSSQDAERKHVFPSLAC